MMLEVADLHAYYGKSHILHGVDLNVREGEIVSLLGRNGVGRSTTCKAIMGLVAPQGTVRYKGREIAGLRSDLVSRAGIGYVPEDRQIFPTLTVRQNLELGLKRAGRFGRWTFDDVYGLFPNLGARADTAAGVLSGGEQQMLSMCRTLMGDPDLVLIDEPTEGLAPKLVEQVGVARRDRQARGGDPAGRAEAHHRAEDLAPVVRDGPRPDRVRGHARRARGQRGGAEGVVGGLANLPTA